MAEFRTGFAAPDGTPLAGFVGAGGVTFAPAGYAGGLGILANRVTHVAPNNPALYVASIKPDTADCYTETLLYVVTAASNARGGAALRVTIDGASKAAFYALRYHGGTKAWQIVRVTSSGTPVVIGSAAVNPAAGSRWLLRLEAAGSQLTAYVDGVEVLAVTDDTVTAAGAVGITWDSGSVGGADGQHFEDLAGGDLGAVASAYSGTLAALAGRSHAALAATHAAPVWGGGFAALSRTASAAASASHTAPVWRAQLRATAEAAGAALAASHSSNQASGSFAAQAAPASAALTATHQAPVWSGALAAASAPATAHFAVSGGRLLWAGAFAAVAGRARARVEAGVGLPVEWAACGARPVGAWTPCHATRPHAN